MHKRTLSTIVVAFVLSLLFVFGFVAVVEAKTVSSNDFNVTVGGEEYVYAILEDVVHDGETKQQVHIRVNINKDKVVNDSEVYKFVWTHKFELYQGGNKILEEIDILPKKEGDNYSDNTTFYTKNTQEELFFSKEGYLFVGYDIDTSLEYTVKLYNSFSCVDCPEGYEYKEQVLDIIELKLAFDTSMPTVDLGNFSKLIRIENNNRIIDNGSSFAISFSDDKSGVKDAYFLLTDKTYHQGNSVFVGDLIKDDNVQKIESNVSMKVELPSSSYNDAILATTCFDFFYGYYECVKAYYAYFVVIDNSENIYVNLFAFGLDIDKDKNDIEYTGNISEEGTYKSISIDINPTYDTYYALTENNFVELRNITSKYVSPITLGGSENGEYYLHMVQYDNDGNALKLTRKYTFDNTAPVVDTTISTIPVENTSYKNVVIGVHFKDVYSKENQLYDGVGVDKAYYLFSSTLLEEVDYSTINNSYVIGEKITISNVVDGTYYVYFRVLDNLDNQAVYKYTYIIDNTPPEVNIVDYSVNTKPTTDPYVSFTVTGSNTVVYRCGWFVKGQTPTYSQLTQVCNPSTNIHVNVEVEGEYVLWIYASDKAGNEIYKTSPVLLVDRKGPSVSYTNSVNSTDYLYSNPITISAIDVLSSVDSKIYYGWSKVGSNLDEDDLIDYVEDGVIDYPLGLYGTYNLYVKTSDTLGNKSFKKIDYVYYIDTDDIILNLYGDKTITIIKNTKYDEDGASAYKKSNKNVKVEVIIEGEVDTSKAGKYVIKYIAGEGELQQVQTRTIIVKEVNHYYIITGVAFGVGILVSVTTRFVRDKKKRV